MVESHTVVNVFLWPHSLTLSREAQALLSKERGVFTTSGGHHLVLFSNGKKNAKNCEKAPRTCRLIEAFPEAARCKVGEVKLSVLPPQSHFPPRAGPTNTRLELILPLSLTTATEDHALRVRAAEETRWGGGERGHRGG